jgi:hypothetical protein
MIGRANVLAESYVARHGSGFAAYMSLQKALMSRWVAQGGTEESWCSRLAPLFRARYAVLIEELGSS